MRRTWQLGPFVDADGDRIPLPDGERDREMIHAGWMIDRLGGSLVIGPLRVRSQDGFTTVGLGIKYDSGNIPAVDSPRGERGDETGAGPQTPETEPPIPEPPAEPEPAPEAEVQLPEAAIPEPALAEMS